MRGSKAKRLRRENPSIDLGYRPALYTHPINPDLPSRKERRDAHRRFRAFIGRCTRARNVEAAKRGVPTPTEPVRAAIKRAGTAISNDPDNGSLLFPRAPKWTAWRGAMVPKDSL